MRQLAPKLTPEEIAALVETEFPTEDDLLAELASRMETRTSSTFPSASSPAGSLPLSASPAPQ